MKAHTHRLLQILPDLCNSPLILDIDANFDDGTFVAAIKSARMDSHSLYLSSDNGLGDVQLYVMDRDSITSIELNLDEEKCAEAGVEMTFDAILEHARSLKKRAASSQPQSIG